MRGASALCLLVALAGCSSQPSANQSPGSSARATAPASASAPTPSPTNPTNLAFSCRLPVYRHDQPGPPNLFITFPAGTTTPAGSGGHYLDLAVNRWLPVERWQISPDGRRYAYTEGWSNDPPIAPRLHIVDAATGRDLRVIATPSAQPFIVTDFTTQGVFLVIGFEGIGPGVWRADPATGLVSKVSEGYYVAAGPTWITAVDPRDRNPYRSALSGMPSPDRLDRRDAAGTVTTWLYKPGMALMSTAFAGRDEVLVLAIGGVPPGPATYEYWLVTGPDQTALVARFGDPGPHPDLNGFSAAISDSHGVWIGDSSGLYLVPPAGPLEMVFDQPVYPANGCV